MTTERKWALVGGGILLGLVVLLVSISSTVLPGNWVNAAFVIVGVASASGTWWLIRRVVLARLALLNASVDKIAVTKDLSARVAATGNDELSRLAQSINEMLDTLERAQRELQASEERYRAVVEQTADGIYLIDVETKRVLNSNAAFQHLLGYAAEQVLEHAVYDFVVDAPANIDTALERILAEERPLTSAQQYRRNDGSIIDVWVSAGTVSFGGRRVLAMLVRDATAQKQAQAELSAHARQQAAVAELGQRALLGADLTALMREAVTAVARTLDVEYCKVLELLPDGNAELVHCATGATSGHAGRPAGDPEAKSPLGDSPPATAPATVTLVQANNALGEPLLREPGMVSGTSIIIHGRVAPLGILGAYTRRQRVFTEDDLHFLQTVANVLAGAIERKQTDEALQESERRYKTLFDNASDAILIHDLEGRLLEVNRIACERLGYTHEELLQATSMEAVAPEYAARLAEAMENLRRQNHVVFETVHVRRGGGQIPIEVSSRLIEYGGSPAVLCMARDVTERKQAQEALEKERTLLAQRVEERTAELSAANAALAGTAQLKDEFLASMSHELRTPLNTILGMTEALEEEAYGPLNEDQQSSLHIVEESGRHLLDLINDILDLSKIGAGKLELEIGPVPVESVCRASLGLVKQIAHKKNLRVSFDFDDAVKTILADARRLKQILVNLLSNAIKFTPENGAVGLEVTGDVDRQVVRFSVWDTGIGIAKLDLDRLFQPFVQLDSRLARQYGGTGLGLALVYRMVEMHAGGVLVESEPGQGSRFTVSLPWQAADVEEAALEQASLHIARPAEPTVTSSSQPPFSTLSMLPTILVADDNPGNINALSRYFESKGYRVIVARNGSEAVARAREEHPDMILMDIQMPMMDGLEATRRIRADVNLATIPIIALTALAMPGDRERCLEAGMNDYMSKPVSLKELVKAVEAQIWKGI